MKLLLDEMWSPSIAREVRTLGHDVVAIGESDVAARYAGQPDHEVLQLATEEGRAVVTDNVADFEHARRQWAASGRRPVGVIYALDPPFNRHRGPTVIGQMVRALADFLGSAEAIEPFDRAHFLREARRR